MKEDSKHFIEYSVIIFLVFVAFVFLYIYRFNHVALMILSSCISVFYVLWGIIHHALENRLTKLIFVEYLVFGLLIFLLLSTVIYF